MKKLILILSLVCMLVLILVGCGPSQEDFDKLSAEKNLMIDVVRAERDLYEAERDRAEAELELAKLRIDYLEDLLERINASLAKEK